MTPEARAQYKIVQKAVAAGLLNAEERQHIATRPTKPGWPAYVDELRARLVGNSRVVNKFQ